MKLIRPARALLLIGRYRRAIAAAILHLRAAVRGGMTPRVLKQAQDNIAGLRDGLAFYTGLVRRSLAGIDPQTEAEFLASY